MFGPNIEKLEKRGDVDALIKALSSKRQSVQDEAIAALARMGDARAVEPLIAAVEERKREWRRREKAWSRLSATPLSTKTWRAEEKAREEARQTADEAFEACRVALQPLGDFARGGDQRAIEYLLTDWWTPLSPGPVPLGPDAVLEALAAGRPPARAIAARWLVGSPGYADALEPLLAALADEDPEVRLAAAAALEGREDLTVEALLTPCRSEHPEIRVWAAGRLGELGGDRAAELLAGALADDDPEVRAGAALALGELGDARAVKPLIPLLKERGPDAWAAFVLLQEMGGTEAGEAFAEGAPKVGDSVRVAVEGEMYAGMPGDRVYMGEGEVGHWAGKVEFVSDEGVARVRCDEVAGEVDDVQPGSSHAMKLDPRHVKEPPGSSVHWSFEL